MVKFTIIWTLTLGEDPILASGGEGSFWEGEDPILASGGEGFLFGFYCKSRLVIGVNRRFVVVKEPLNRISGCWARAEIRNPRFTEVRLLFTR